MYTDRNYKTKKALKESVKAGEKVAFYQPGPFGGSCPESGTICIEGPHYPEPHRFYATCKVENGYIVAVK